MLRSILLASLVLCGSAQMDVGCIAKHCAMKMVKAIFHPQFLLNSMCELGCQNNFDKDTTPEKLHYQNCTTTCAVSHESEAGDAFLACAMNNFCVDFPPIPGHCPYKPEHIKKGSSLASAQGEWWQQRGKNALWDCYDCQHVHSMYMSNDTDFCAKTIFPEKGPVKAPCWAYTYSYDLYLTSGGTKTFQQTWQLPGDIPDGERIDIYYNYMGSWHNESWFILEATDNYWILGDCSYMMDWIDVGSILWVRPGYVLSDAENAHIKSVYKNTVGFDYDTFCYDKHEYVNGCTDPKKMKSGVRYQAPPRRHYQGRPGQKKPFMHPDMIKAELAKLGSQVVV